MNFKQKLQAGYVKPIRNVNYLKYVSSLECPCGAPADEAHHAIDVGLGKGMGTKASDLCVLPVCRNCHNLIHHNREDWEYRFGPQLLWVYLTIEQAVNEGVIEV